MAIAISHKPRDAYFDNLKVILIIMVVLAHFAEVYARIRTMHGLFNLLTPFVMPVFIFITGYFSKGIDRQRKSDLIKVLLPYFLLQLYHLIFTKATGLGSGSFNAAIPTFQNWYLLALFIWRLLVPYYNFLSLKGAVIASFSISLTIGFIPQFNKFLALHRAIYFMSFFVLGYFSPNINKLLTKVSRYRLVIIGLFLCLVSTVFFVSYFNRDLAGILTYAYNPVFGYHDMKHYPVETFYPFLTRLAGLCTSIIISALFMFAIPRQKTWFSKYGRNTLYVFLFHMFIVWPIATLSYKPIVTELLAVVLSIVITFILSHDSFVNILRPLTNPLILLRKRKIVAKKQD
ncbi:MAG TPA: acyltransferase family protein [Flavitalea sp.]|nr:acyltransferase family protein [Flavitalea sp.]